MGLRTMPHYKIFQLAEPQVERFRTAAPRPGPVALRLRHYQEAGEIQADGPYEAWKRLQGEAARQVGAERPLGVGDVLAEDDGPVLVCNYWGFDEATWADAEPALAE